MLGIIFEIILGAVGVLINDREGLWVEIALENSDYIRKLVIIWVDDGQFLVNRLWVRSGQNWRNVVGITIRCAVKLIDSDGRRIIQSNIQNIVGRLVVFL